MARFVAPRYAGARMADPPSIRRLHVRPPPIPARGPVGPLAGQTVVPTAAQSDEVGDDTSSLLHGVQLVAHLLELIASEAAALLATEDATGRLAELNLRSALASWDALDQREEGLRLLALADAHPLAPRLRAMALLNDATRLAAMSGAGEPAREATGALAIDERSESGLSIDERSMSGLSIDERSESGARRPAGSAGVERVHPLSINERS